MSEALNNFSLRVWADRAEETLKEQAVELESLRAEVSALMEKHFQAVEAQVKLIHERDALHASLSNILASVRAYLPPDEVTKDELIGRVIEQVDPWPAGAPLPREARGVK